MSGQGTKAEGLPTDYQTGAQWEAATRVKNSRELFTSKTQREDVLEKGIHIFSQKTSNK
jgi:hypothetical protein